MAKPSYVEQQKLMNDMLGIIGNIALAGGLKDKRQETWLNKTVKLLHHNMDEENY